MLSVEQCVSALSQVTGAFADSLRDADDTVDVTTCPGWAVHDLAVHLGRVHRWAGAVVLGADMPRMPKPLIDRPLAEWYRGTADAMIAAMGAVASEEPIPNFAHVNEVAAFWPRRQLHEVTVHLRDLTLALGHPDLAVAPRVAADGVDEVLTVSFHLLAARKTPPVVQEPIRIIATDTGDEWVITPESIGQIASSDTSCSASISGTAADLYLGFWRRVPREKLSLDGEAAIALFDGPTSR